MKASTTSLAAFLCLLVSSAIADEPEPDRRFIFLELADRATFSDEVLTLDGVDGAVHAFTDRPYRNTATLQLAELVANWDRGQDSFIENPPTVAVSGISDGNLVSVIAVLNEPKIEGTSVVFRYQMVGGGKIREFKVTRVIQRADGLASRSFSANARNRRPCLGSRNRRRHLRKILEGSQCRASRQGRSRPIDHAGAR